jgi:hypothetical protein
MADQRLGWVLAAPRPGVTGPIGGAVGYGAERLRFSGPSRRRRSPGLNRVNAGLRLLHALASKLAGFVDLRDARECAERLAHKLAVDAVHHDPALPAGRRNPEPECRQLAI